MRKILAIPAIAVLLCSASFAQNNSSNRETIEGNGKLVTREVPVKSFDALKAGGVYELKLTQGDKESVKIEADENLQEMFTVTNDGSKLVIDTRKLNNKNLKTKTKMRVYVTFRNIKSLEVTTVGNMQSESELKFDNLELNAKSVGNVNLKLTVKQLNLDNKSVGDIRLSGSAENAVVKNKGVGSLEASDFVVQTMDIENSGVGHAEVNAAKTLKVKDSFLGKVKNKGAAPVRSTKKVVI